MVTYLFIIAVAGHLAVAAFSLYDLVRVSKRSNKLAWAFMMLALPLVGVIAYDLTKKRRRYLRSES